MESPMASLSRYPYPEYHSDKDNISIIDPAMLEESVDILLKGVLELDRSTLMRKKFEGVLALSNPAYNLYVDPGQPAFGSVAPAQHPKVTSFDGCDPDVSTPNFCGADCRRSRFARSRRFRLLNSMAS